MAASSTRSGGVSTARIKPKVIDSYVPSLSIHPVHPESVKPKKKPEWAGEQGWADASGSRRGLGSRQGRLGGKCEAADAQEAPAGPGYPTINTSTDFPRSRHRAAVQQENGVIRGCVP
ncbi:unnamed protein product [Boreogadus saida]